MEEKIFLNPSVQFISLDNKNLYLKIDKKLYHLTGDKLEKYFLKNVEYFFAPKKIYDLTQLFLKKNKIEFDQFEFNEVIEILLEKNILIIANSNQSEHVKVNRLSLKCINYSSKNISKNLKQKLRNISQKECFINYSESYHEIPEDLSSEDIIVLIMDRWNEMIFIDKLEKIKKDMKKNSILLPVILNPKYFSVGPQVLGDESLRKLKIYLNKEESRSAYYFNRTDNTYYTIPIAFIINEIYFIATKQNHNSYSYSRMLTYNLNSKEFKKIRYEEL